MVIMNLDRVYIQSYAHWRVISFLRVIGNKGRALNRKMVRWCMQALLSPRQIACYSGIAIDMAENLRDSKPRLRTGLEEL